MKQEKKSFAYFLVFARVTLKKPLAVRGLSAERELPRRARFSPIAGCLLGLRERTAKAPRQKRWRNTPTHPRPILQRSSRERYTAHRHTIRTEGSFPMLRVVVPSLLSPISHGPYPLFLSYDHASHPTPVSYSFSFSVSASVGGGERRWGFYAGGKQNT